MKRREGNIGTAMARAWTHREENIAIAMAEEYEAQRKKYSYING